MSGTGTTADSGAMPLPAVGQPAPPPSGGDLDVPVDDTRIERQLARADRWRHPDWSLVCQAADKRRQRRLSHQAESIAVALTEPSAESDSGWRRRLPRYWAAWLISILLHATILATLAVYALPRGSGGDEDVFYVIGDHRRSDVLSKPPQLLEVAVPSPIEIRASGSFVSPVSEPSRVVDAGALAPSIALTMFAEQDSGPVGEVSSLFGSVGAAMAASGEGREGADFFGVRAVGKSFVFLVDCSLSMSMGPKWLDATRELTAAVERLGDDKYFYVICFDQDSHRMFGPDSPEPDFVPATPENLARLQQWLLTMGTGFCSWPADSVEFALTLEPDAVYLISDGDIQDETDELLRRQNRVRTERGRRPVVIVHTIALHSRSGERQLQRIAKENGGRFVRIAGPQGTPPLPRQE
jgi:hypothetical protein